MAIEDDDILQEFLIESSENLGRLDQEMVELEQHPDLIAGNLKPLLPPGVGLSLPSVVEGSDYSLRICGGNLSESVWFEDRFGPLSITLVELISSALPTSVGPPAGTARFRPG